MTKTPRTGHLLSGLVGGLCAVAVGLALVLTGVVDVGGDGGGATTPLSAQPITEPASDDGGGDGLTVNEIYDRASPGVILVEAEGTSGESPLGLPTPREGIASGSGFVLDREGFVLTNAHVVDGADEVRVTFNDDTQVPAEVVGSDLSSDLAVLQVDPGDVDLEPLPLGDSGDVEVGNPAVAIGNPFGFDRTVTTGIVSAIQRQIEAPNGFSIANVIQTDASINAGNSGGPLLDARGRVIGINSQIATGSGGGSVGIGFAVPVDTARSVIPQLKDDGEVERAFLGVSTTDVTPSIAEELDLSVEQGAYVAEVTPGGPAEEGGLEPDESAGGAPGGGGDVIVAVDGDPVTESAEVAALIADDAPGDTVEIEVVRGEDRETLEVELGERPPEAEPAAGGGPPGGGGPPRGGGPPGGGGGLPFPLP
jgi:S1-C subfamily serine protease